uniref:Ubiquitin-like protease family profile domain-containing protein n=1 Tax=Ditylenchus dipsaci TaxID=166011 RepID=A0A915CU62_9BILA
MYISVNYAEIEKSNECPEHSARSEWEDIKIDGCSSAWTLALVAVKIKKHRLIYYDSLLSDGHICLSLIKKYLEQESMQKGHQGKDPVNWLGFNDKTIPPQSNCYDCGIFVCLFAESVSRDARPDFKQQQVKEIRKKISKEIFDGAMSEPKKIDKSIVGWAI